MADLGGDVILVGAGGEERRYARVAQRVGRDLIADRWPDAGRETRWPSMSFEDTQLSAGQVDVLAG